MEFRPIVRRLAGARGPSSLSHSRQFTTDSKLESAAAPAVATPTTQPQSQFQPRRPIYNKPPSASQVRADNIRLKVQNQTLGNLPPRPAPFARSSFLDTPRGQPNVTSPSSNILSTMRSDMEKSTASQAAAAAEIGLAKWQTTDFLKKYNFSTVEMRLRPSTGRTIPVQGSVDVARAFKILEGNCRANNVKSDDRQQKFHERPALKRKRLRRDRWRERFGQGFRATISRVMELRGQGW
ncbi:hypothetical protein QBC44DRAFT_156657 [Cladorrhinum sp. PSN332]|nr:hypothetical protein QBC44DRAFT_156657 [Cladorrhinum sp. PSN332]